MKLLENLLNKINNSNKNIVYPVDFHIHTSWTDGKNTVKEMYNSSLKKGIKAILFSEHVRKKSLNWYEDFANEVKSLPKDKCHAFVGAETKIIDFSGNLDCPDIVLKMSNLLMGAVHRFPGEIGNIKDNKTTISKKEAIETEYELSRKLLKYSNIDILGHPFGMSYKRFNATPNKKYIIDLINLAQKYNKLYEINAAYHPNPWELIKICKAKGTRFTLGSNAHNVDDIGKIIRKLEGSDD